MTHLPDTSAQSALTARGRRALVGAATTFIAVASLPSVAFGLLSGTTPPATDAPPATAAPVTTPGTVPATTTPDAGGGGDWGPIAFGIVLLVAAIVVIAVLMSRRAPSTPAPRTSPVTTSASSSPAAQLLGTAQWIHDQLSLDLMAAAAPAAAALWGTERARLKEVGITAQQQWAAGGGDTWQSLAQSMSALEGALATNITLRSQDYVDAHSVHESTTVVNRQRAMLQQEINDLWPTIQH
jgi:hypothetical protein